MITAKEPKVVRTEIISAALLFRIRPETDIRHDNKAKRQEREQGLAKHWHHRRRQG